MIRSRICDLLKGGMNMQFDLQQFGGGGGGGGGGSAPPQKISAPGSTAAATIDSATAGERQSIHDKLAKAKGRASTDKTGGTLGGMSDMMGSIKKALLGE